MRIRYLGVNSIPEFYVVLKCGDVTVENYTAYHNSEFEKYDTKNYSIFRNIFPYFLKKNKTPTV